MLGIYYESLKVIEGNCGFEASISILIHLSEMVAFSLGEGGVIMNSEEMVKVLDNSRVLLQYIAENREKVFSTACKIFPPTFPPKYTGFYKHDMITDLDRTIEKWSEESFIL